MKPDNSEHSWRFFRVGGIDQVKLDSAADLANLEHLDPKLWVALSCPVSGLEFDDRTLELIDTDGDGHVHTGEVTAAVQWAEERLLDLSSLIEGRDELPLAAIDDRTEAGQTVLASARQILANLGKPEAESITIAEACNLEKIFHETSFNGDGIVPVNLAGDDEQVRQVLQEIIDALGPETDRSGQPGVSQEKADRFFEELRALSQWRRQAEDDADILPFGDASDAIAAAVDTVCAKVDDYFARCRLAAYDPRALTALNRAETEYLEVVAGELSVTAEEVAEFPLARIEAGKPLPLGDELNPAWASRIAELVDLALRPLFGEDKVDLSAQEWSEIKGKLAPYRDWRSKRPETAAGTPGVERARAILSEDVESRIGALLAKDKALEAEVAVIGEVERLARYSRDLYRLLNNFVSFSDFYDPDRLAIFQAGTLYIDGRTCELCVQVDDPGQHSKRVGMSSGFYLAYCNCERVGCEPRKIAAVVTDGDSDNLRVGRNGLFYDRDGLDWDATIIKILPQSISLREAFFSPYKRIAALVESQVEKIAAARDEEVITDASAGIESAGTAVDTVDVVKKPAPPPFDIAKFAGIFAAIGLAVGAIGTAIAAIVQGFFGLALWQMPLAVAGILLTISGPAMLLTTVKLRRRNLGLILDANGWAVNGSVLVNIPFGASLTKLAALPPNSSRSLRDPFPMKKRLWPWVLLVLALLAGGLWMLHETDQLRAWGISFDRSPEVIEEVQVE